MSVLGYHDFRQGFEAGISSIPLQRFARQLDWFQEQSCVFGPLDLAREHPTHLSLTFDDAIEHQVEESMGLLAERSMTATLFVPTRYVGQTASWDYRGRSRRHANWALLRRWCEAGHTVGSHGASHRDLSALDGTELTRELRESRDVLEEHLGRAVRLLSYPFGRTDARVARAAENVGYEAAFTTLPSGSRSDPYRQPRCMVSLLDTPLALEHRMRGTCWGRLERAKQRTISLWSGGTAWQQRKRQGARSVACA